MGSCGNGNSSSGHCAPRAKLNGAPNGTLVWKPSLFPTQNPHGSFVFWQKNTNKGNRYSKLLTRSISFIVPPVRSSGYDGCDALGFRDSIIQPRRCQQRQGLPALLA